MTLDEVIIHCEEVAEGNEYDAKEYNRLAKLETCPSRKECESAYKRCCKCASEHRQLAEWLKELKELRQRNNGNDLVKKQDVIKLLDMCWKKGKYPTAGNIEALPPARQKVIMCKE